MKAGQSEIYIGKAKKQLGLKIVNNFVATLKSFLNTELKNITVRFVDYSVHCALASDRHKCEFIQFAYSVS